MITRYKHQRDLRRSRIRAKIKGTADRPRLAVFKSNKYIYGQVIDDVTGKTLCEENSRKIEEIKQIGINIAKKCLEKKIKTIVFDRGGYKYHGQVKALAEGAREGGLQF